MLTHHVFDRHRLKQQQSGQWLPQEFQARRENFRQKRAVSLEQQLERLTDAYLAQVVALDEYKRRRQDLEQRLQAIAGQVRSTRGHC